MRQHHMAGAGRAEEYDGADSGRFGRGRADVRASAASGEEFGYVLSGSIFLVDGETKTRIRAGSSFCLHPHETHYLMNAGKSHAKVLWISTPPSFLF